MGRLSILLFGIHIYLFAFIGSFISGQTCPRPDLPVDGYYIPNMSRFEPGDDITYRCMQTHILVGKRRSKCKSNGMWSNPSPFCDGKVILRNPLVTKGSGKQEKDPDVIDEDTKTCSLLTLQEKLDVTMDKQSVVYAVRLFLESEADVTNFVVSTEGTTCGENYIKYIGSRHWIVFVCENNTKLTNTVSIQSLSTEDIDICEIEVYVKDEDGCEKPPKIKVTNGYFRVSRSKAVLICEEGYKSNFSRLVCENNKWDGLPRSCKKKEMSNGNNLEENDNRTFLVYAVVGISVALFITALGSTVYFICRQRGEQVMEIFPPPAEYSEIKESDMNHAEVYTSMNGYQRAFHLKSSTRPVP